MNYTILAAVIASLGALSGVEAKDIGSSEICKATIATIMGRDVSIIKSDKSAGGVEYLSYVRADGTLWAYRCRVEGDRVIWASDSGRWRTHSADEVLTYKLSQDRQKLTIKEKYADGSAKDQTFAAPDF